MSTHFDELAHYLQRLVAAIRAVSRMTFLHDKVGAAADATAALASDPTNVDASLVRHALDHHAITLDAARAVTTAHPQDWRSWWLLAHVATGQVAHDAALQMCSTATADPSAAIDPQLCAAAAPP